METAEFGLWSHGALDGPRGSTTTSGDYGLDGTHLSSKGWGEINFNWKNNGNDAKAMFFGCRTAGNEKGTVTPWAQTISANANMKNVSVFGQVDRSYPTLYPDAGVQNVDIVLHTHTYPRYMVSGKRDLFTRLSRKAAKGFRGLPMGVYVNGNFIRHQYQGHKYYKYNE